MFQWVPENQDQVWGTSEKPGRKTCSENLGRWSGREGGLEDNLKVNEIYMQWYRLHLEAGKEEETDSSRIFADFFECVQVRCKKICVI